MTLDVVFVSGKAKTTIRENILALCDKGKYHFCGTTWHRNRYEANNLLVHKYYALTSDLGIGVTPNQIVLFSDGKEEMAIQHEAPEMLSKHFRFGPELMASRDTNASANSPWAKMKSIVAEQASSCDKARRLLYIIKQWELESLQTANVVNTIMSEQKRLLADGDSPLLHVAGQQWIWYNSKSDQTFIGYGSVVWGQVFLPIKHWFFSGVVAPINDGWLVALSTGQYLIQWDKQSNQGVSVQQFLFPIGEWERSGEWTFWPCSYRLLTPASRLVVAPDGFWEGASKEWAFFRRPSVMCAVDPLGNQRACDIPEEYDCGTLYCFGDNVALIIYQKDNKCFFSIAEANREPLLRPLWTAAMPQVGHINNIIDVYALRESPDAFVVVFGFGQGKRALVLRLVSHGGLLKTQDNSCEIVLPCAGGGS